MNVGKPLLGTTAEQAERLTELAAEVDELTTKFFKGQFGVLTLPTQAEAEYRSLMSLSRATLREFLGPTHEFTFQLMRLDREQTISDGPSMANVQEVVAALKGAARYLDSRPRVPASQTAAASMSLTELHQAAEEEGRQAYLEKTNFPSESSATRSEASNQVFLVHGHDHGSRDMVARFVEKLGLRPIILDEQANQNQTIIEKLEKHSTVGFAIVLLTPDDEGRSSRESLNGIPLKGRARQNVLLELGYFMGRLTRARVCALARGNVEIPSDLGGVLCEQLDDQGAWKVKLARELDAAGYEVDWRKLGDG